MKISNINTKQLLSRALLIFLIGAISCTKEREGKNYTAIYGKVLDYYTLEPIPDVQVFMKDGLAATGFIILDPMATNIIDTAYTDKNGFFFVELNDHYYNANIGVVSESYNSYQYYIEDNCKNHSFAPGIYPDYTIRLKPREDE